MTIHPLLQEGLSAYHRGQYRTAREYFEAELAVASDEEERSIVLALAQLAGASEAQDRGQADVAQSRLQGVRDQLDLLSSPTLGVDLVKLRTSLPEPGAPLPLPPPRVTAASRLPVRALVRFALFVALVGAALFLLQTPAVRELLSREELVATLGRLRESWWAPLGLLLLYVVLAPLGVPITPLVFAGGAVFGTVQGTVVNYVGALLGAAASFLLARGLAHDLVHHVLGHRLKRVTRFLRQRSFWTLVRMRFIPIPYVVANFGTAVAGVRLSHFLISTAIGMLPVMLVSSYLASTFVEAAEGQRGGQVYQLLGAMFLFLGISFVPSGWIGWKRRKRYREILKARSGERPGRCRSRRHSG